MKTTLLFSTGLACLLLVGRTFAATDVVAGWNAELDNVQQTSLQNSAGRTRADAIVRAVLVGAMTGIEAEKQSGRPAEPAPVGANLDAAAAQAAYSVMAVLYPQNLPALDARLAQSLAEIDDSTSAIAAGKKWGEHVAHVILAEESDAVSLNPYTFVERAQPPAAPAPIPKAQAEQAAIGPGRYQFSVLAGSPGTKGHMDGIGTAARFDRPSSIAVDALGNVYLSEEDLCTIRKISPNGVVSTLAGVAGQKGSQDGTGSAARFSQPRGLAVDSAGNVFVADIQNHTIRKIDSAGLVTTVAGIAGQSGHMDGAKEAARLDTPAYVALDGAGNVFFADGGTIRKMMPDGSVSTLRVTFPDYKSAAGENNYSGAWPWQMCVDQAGNLYVIYSDAWDFSGVVKFSPTANGTYEGKTLQAPGNLRWASEIGLDAAGNLYVYYYGNPICVHAPDGEVLLRSVAGNPGGWDGMAVDGSGALYAVSGNFARETRGTIEIGVFDPDANGPVILAEPYVQTPTFTGDYGEAYVGDSVKFNIQTLGGPGLTYQWYLDSTPISGATNDTLALSKAQKSDAGYYSVVVTDAGGRVTSNKAQLVVKDAPPPPPLPPPPALTPITAGSGSANSGGGSCDAAMSIAVLSLLAMAARRGRRTFKIAAVGPHHKEERA